MKKHFLFTILLFITGGLHYVTALEAHVEQTSNDVPVVAPLNLGLVHFYDTELFHLMHIGFGNVTLIYQNQLSFVGLFGARINNNARMAFSLYEETHREIQSFDSKTVWGHIFMWGGLAALITGSILIANSEQWVSNDPYCFNRNRRLETTNYVMMGTGIGLAVIGGISIYISPFVFLSRSGNLSRAASLFNRQRVLEFANAPSMLTPR